MPRCRTTTTILLGLILAAAMSWAAGTAAAEESITLPVPEGLRLTGTNGYSGYLVAAQREGAPGGAILAVHRRGASVTYATRAEVTETTIKARFGALGEIDVHAVDSGRTVHERGCGPPVKVESGRWEGTIRFHGEGGFTSIEAASVPATAAPFLSLICARQVDEGIGGHSPGALMTVRRRRGAEMIRLEVRKNKRVGPTRVEVEASERRGDIAIDRSLAVVDPSSAFDFEFPPGLATFEPPQPFGGSLTLTRGPSSAPSVHGDLRVDLPGRSAVPILGPGSVHASLVRAVLNPSHPF